MDEYFREMSGPMSSLLSDAVQPLTIFERVPLFVWLETTANESLLERVEQMPQDLQDMLHIKGGDEVHHG